MDMAKPRSLSKSINASLQAHPAMKRLVIEDKVIASARGPGKSTAHRMEREMVLDMDAVKRMPNIHVKPSEDELYDYARKRYMNDHAEGAAARRRRKQMEKQRRGHGTD